MVWSRKNENNNVMEEKIMKKEYINIFINKNGVVSWSNFSDKSPYEVN